MVRPGGVLEVGHLKLVGLVSRLQQEHAQIQEVRRDMNGAECTAYRKGVAGGLVAGATSTEQR